MKRMMLTAVLAVASLGGYAAAGPVDAANGTCCPTACCDKCDRCGGANCSACCAQAEKRCCECC
jgi:hypothetical protein